MAATKKERIISLIEQAHDFRFCGPSDDPDEQTAVTSGYRYLVVQFKRLAGPMLPEEPASRLNSINVEINDLYSAYDAKAELDALIPDIEAALEFSDDAGVSRGTNMWIVEPGLIGRLAEKQSGAVDVGSLVKMCREINSSYAHANVLATALLMRTVLNHVPPVFGHDTFSQVLANIGKSLKDSFEHLENGLRKVADFHAHRKIAASESYPSAAQVEPFKPQFELLLQQVEARLSSK
ncbi:MAG: hypothetical protein WB679_23800 [Terracidiphilus sp.]